MILLNVAFTILVVIVFVYLVFPFFWAISSSLKTQNELFATPLVVWPPHPKWHTYVEIFMNQPFARNLLNSAIVAGVTTLLSLVIGGPAAYCSPSPSPSTTGRVRYPSPSRCSAARVSTSCPGRRSWRRRWW